MTTLTNLSGNGVADPTASPIETLHEALHVLGLSEADAVVEAHLERASKQEHTWSGPPSKSTPTPSS